ncbi:calpain-5-like isoform X4 [Haliotis rufescens]|nr:calpain-5-like isoform X4 [Haliotis rufescens]
MPSNFRGQGYSKLKKACLKKGELFEDPEFPANNKSLFFSKIDNDVVWMRPKELCKVPRLVVEGVSCDDLNQGSLGNSWFVNACTSLAQEPKMWQRVVVDHRTQEWSDKNQYAGIFRFQFWRFGDWVDVVVDDRLPTKDGKLIFCHSKSRNEFWSALLEKAYAKLYGDYESLNFGYVADALVDFTGGVSEKLETSTLFLDKPENMQELFNKLTDASENKALINAKIECTEDAVGQEAADGLVLGLGYNVTDVKLVQVSRSLQGAVGSDKLLLLRLFNPWGDKEWTGAWSDSKFYRYRSPEWRRVPKSEWEKMGVKFRQEGEFWMSFSDFIQNFSSIQICHFVNTSFFSLKKTWNESSMHSKWSHSGRNGGSNYFSPTFLSNPQYLFDITGASDRIMISLEQHDVGGGRQFLGQDLNMIGFHVMKVEENRKYRVHVPGDKMFTSDYVKSRSVYGTTVLKRGRYVIVPTTKEQGATGDFLLRLYTGSAAGGSGVSGSSRALEKECPSSGCPCVAGYSMVTTITVESAEDLVLPVKAKGKGSLDPMVSIKCEGEKVKSVSCVGTNAPTWSIKATFYRKKPHLPITVDVLNHNMLKNDLLGTATIPDIGTVSGEDKEYDLFIVVKKENERVPGKIRVNIKSSYDLTEL